MRLITCALLLELWPRLQDTPADPIRQRVQEILNSQTEGLGPQLVAKYAQQLAAPLMQAGPSQRVNEILSELPRALDYHVSVVRRYEPTAKMAGVSCQDLLLEGWRIQIDYLGARLSRAVASDRSPGTRATIRAQMELLLDAAQSAGRDALPGDAGRLLVERQMGEVREAWRISVDSIFNSPLDQPLSPADLEAVLTRIRSAVVGEQKVTLREEDVLDSEKLRELGVNRLFDAILKALYLATNKCFAEFSAIEQQSLKWRAEVKQYIGRTVRERGQRVAIAPQSSPSNDTRAAVPQSKAVSPAAPPSGALGSEANFPVPKQETIQQKRPHSDALKYWMAIGLIAVGCLLAWAVVRRRIPQSARK